MIKDPCLVIQIASFILRNSWGLLTSQSWTGKPNFLPFLAVKISWLTTLADWVFVCLFVFSEPIALEDRLHSLLVDHVITTCSTCHCAATQRRKPCVLVTSAWGVERRWACLKDKHVYQFTDRMGPRFISPLVYFPFQIRGLIINNNNNNNSNNNNQRVTCTYTINN